MYDVAIVGAGFSGKLLALKMRNLGLNIVLLEYSSTEKPRLPESTYISPEQFSRKFNLSECEIAKFFSNTYSVSFKSNDGSNEVTISQKTNSTTGPFLIDKTEINKYLFDKVCESGIDTISQAKASFVNFNKGKQVIEYEQKADRRFVAAKYVVDATGKIALLANQLSIKENNVSLDKRTAIFSQFSISDKDKPLLPSSMTIIDIDNGYVFVYPLSGNIFTAGVVLYQKTELQNKEKLFYEVVRSINWLSKLILNSSPLMPVVPVINESFNVSYPCGEGYFIVGEALGFIDPFYCDGFSIAINSILHCCEAISGLFGRDDKSLIFKGYQLCIKNLLNVSKITWDNFFKEHGFSIHARCLSDPHIPYGINYFLSNLYANDHESATGAMSLLRHNLSKGELK